MPTGIGTALLIGGLASAGASAVGGKMASNSAKNAAKTQTAAADKAAALNEQAWQQQQALQRPYQQAGRTAVGNLSALMNPGVPYTPEMQASNQQRMALPPPMPPQGGGVAVPRGAGPFAGAMGQPPGGGPPMPSGPPPPGGPMAQAMAPQAQMVTMEMPGRGRFQVPRQQAQQALAAGGRIVG